MTIRKLLWKGWIGSADSFTLHWKMDHQHVTPYISPSIFVHWGAKEITTFDRVIEQFWQFTTWAEPGGGGGIGFEDPFRVFFHNYSSHSTRLDLQLHAFVRSHKIRSTQTHRFDQKRLQVYYVQRTIVGALYALIDTRTRYSAGIACANNKLLVFGRFEA